jgi:serine/threonine protein kinase
MDYIPGNTLADESSKKAETQTNSAKLHILFHLSNAIRFLETHGISHLDISPHNVIVVKDYLIKLIDFGEAYHQKTSKKYSLQ